MLTTTCFCKNHKKRLTVSTSGNIDCGEIIRGSVKSLSGFDNYILFEISNDKYCSFKSFCISKTGDDGSNEDVSLITEWKAGPCTGFESNYYNGEYQLVHGNFYVSCTVKSVSASSIAEIGDKTFTQTITVEYIDI